MPKWEGDRQEKIGVGELRATHGQVIDAMGDSQEQTSHKFQIHWL